MGSAGCRASLKSRVWKATPLPRGSSSLSGTRASGTTAVSKAHSNPPGCGPFSLPALRASDSIESSSMPLVLGGCELFDQILLAAFASTVLAGYALFRVIRAERRRAASIEPRLKAIALTVSGADRLVVSLRRPPPQSRALPAALAARLDFAFAATGNRIGPLHLAATGCGAAAMIGLVAAMAQFRPALAIALGGAAAGCAPRLAPSLPPSPLQPQI